MTKSRNPTALRTVKPGLRAQRKAVPSAGYRFSQRSSFGGPRAHELRLMPGFVSSYCDGSNGQQAASFSIRPFASHAGNLWKHTALHWFNRLLMYTSTFECWAASYQHFAYLDGLAINHLSPSPDDRLSRSRTPMVAQSPWGSRPVGDRELLPQRTTAWVGKPSQNPVSGLVSKVIFEVLG
jgi:hypothetical protein